MAIMMSMVINVLKIGLLDRLFFLYKTHLSLVVKWDHLQNYQFNKSDTIVD